MERGKLIKGILSGVIAAALTSVLLLLFFAFLLLKLQLDAGKTSLLILLIYLLSNVAGGFVCGKYQERRKFLWGLLTGLFYFVILFAVSGMSEKEVSPEAAESLLSLVLCAVGGMLGGILA